MKNLIIVIDLLIIAIMMTSPSMAGSDNTPTANHANYWNGVWQDFKTDWKEIGNGMKNAGVNIGQAFKKEFKEMPNNIRKGSKSAKNDFKTFINSGRVSSTEK